MEVALMDLAHLMDEAEALSDADLELLTLFVAQLREERAKLYKSYRARNEQRMLAELGVTLDQAVSMTGMYNLRNSLTAGSS
jgi:hypothetical protein